jgi:hypothetical protein
MPPTQGCALVGRSPQICTLHHKGTLKTNFFPLLYSNLKYIYHPLTSLLPLLKNTLGKLTDEF